MRKITLPFLLIVALSFVSQTEINTKRIERFEFEKFIKTHEYSVRKHIPEKELKKIPKAERPDLAYEQDFLATLDPALGYPPVKKLLPIYSQVKAFNNNITLAPGGTTSPWVERGPNNVGGRTRAIMYDPNDPTQKKVWAGGVSGGLWYNNDITSATSSWQSVNDFWDNLAITCIAYDPNDSSIFYVGTGESVGKASRGAGIWKSTNSGTSWTQLSSTSAYYYVNDIVVRNESGTSVVYAAVDSRYYTGAWHNPSAAGLRRSTNGGSSWTQVMPNVPSQTINFVVADIEIDKNNNLWVGTKTSPYGATDRGGGRILKSSNGTTWSIKMTETVNNNYSRVEIACAPSNANYIYAIVADYGVVKTIKQSTNGGTSWSSKNEPNDVDPGIPSTDFSRGQGVYCLTAAVDPNNPTTLIVGGINLFKSTNGGTSWSQMSVWQWSGAWNYQWVHADQQNTIYKPGSSSEVLFTTDGGVFYTDSISYPGINSSVIKEDNPAVRGMITAVSHLVTVEKVK